MAGGIYTALSGMRSRSEQLDRLASDIANSATSGYKSERAGSVAVNRPVFEQMLNSAVDSAPTAGQTDFTPGAITPTGRDLDLAIEGNGFFVLNTPRGERYTRNGHFDRSVNGTLVTSDGMDVLGENGPIQLGKGDVTIRPDGTVMAGKTPAGKLRIVSFQRTEGLSREDGARFRASAASAPSPVEGPTVRNGALEQSNASVVERVVELTQVMRSFEALQRGISLMSNDIDGRVISELGRR